MNGDPERPMNADKRMSRWLPILISLAFALNVPANAQLELVVIEKPFTAHSLSGTVSDPTGSPVAGAVIEECDAPFTPIEAKDPQGRPTGTVLHGDCTRNPSRIDSSTVTDLKGHFTIRSAKTGKVHYLHISSPGFDPMQITVRLTLFAKAGVRIQLRIAT